MLLRLPNLEIDDIVKFKKVPIIQPFPKIMHSLGIYHYLAVFCSSNNKYEPFCIGFYPILDRPNQLLFTAFIPKNGRLISPDPFHKGDEEYLKNCNSNDEISYKLDKHRCEFINNMIESSIYNKRRNYINLSQYYSIIPISRNTYNCRTWLFHLFPELHRDAWCHSKYYQFINTIYKKID